MNLDLQGKRAIVCGSTRGIGKAIAIELSTMGAAITLIARNEERLQATIEELATDHGQQHEYLVADFAFPEKLRDVVQPYCDRTPVQILINNTGGPPGGKAIEAETDAFVSAFSAHLLCNQILVKAVVPAMRAAGYGRVINVISTSVKMPIPGLGVSNTIRGAVANWAKTLSFELAADGITVNNVLPGSTMTGRLEEIIQANADKTGQSFEEARQQMINEIPARRLATPDEVAAAAAFLASPAAGYINGINIPVDGGRTGTL